MVGTGERQFGQFGLFDPAFDQRRDIQHALNFQYVVQTRLGAWVGRHEKFAAILVRFNRGFIGAEPSRFVDDLALIHADQGTKDRQFRCVFNRTDVLRGL